MQLEDKRLVASLEEDFVHRNNTQVCVGAEKLPCQRLTHKQYWAQVVISV